MGTIRIQGAGRHRSVRAAPQLRRTVRDDWYVIILDSKAKVAKAKVAAEPVTKAKVAAEPVT